MNRLYFALRSLGVALLAVVTTAAIVKGYPTRPVRLLVQAAFEILAPVVAQIGGGAPKALAVTSDERFAGLPDVPTVAESGVPGYQASSWNAVAASAKTPEPVLERLNREVNAAVVEPEVRRRLGELGMHARAGTPEAMHALLVSEIAKWKGVIERAKIEKQ